MGVPVRAKRRVLGAAAVLAGLALAPGPAAASEEAAPDADDSLTLAELRWCVFEPIRLAGDSAETDAAARWEVDGHNARIRAYRERCSGKSYRVRDKTAIDGELTPDRRAALRDDGTARVRQARREREARRVYVRDGTAAVRASPGEAGEELGRVKRWGELIGTGRVRGSWREVEWRNPRLETALKFGWVLGGLVESGSGEEARFEYCEMHAPGKPPHKERAKHGDIVRGRVDPSSEASVSVENLTGKDAYVKLLDESGAVAVSFLAGAGRTARIEGIRLGSYGVAFATGAKFSRGCDSFSRRGSAKKFTRRIDYDADTAGWSLSLHTVRGGNARTNAMDYDDFDRL